MVYKKCEGYFIIKNAKGLANNLRAMVKEVKSSMFALVSTIFWLLKS